MGVEPLLAGKLKPVILVVVAPLVGVKAAPRSVSELSVVPLYNWAAVSVPLAALLYTICRAPGSAAWVML